MSAQQSWRAKLESWHLPVPDFAIEPATTALLVVDMQNTHADPTCGLGRLFNTVDSDRADYYFSRLEQTVIPNVGRLLDVFRSNELHVLYLALGPRLKDGSDLSPNFRRRYRQEEEALGFNVTFQEGTHGYAIIPALVPEEGEMIINKTANSAFNSSNFDRVLRNLGIETLIVTGVGTDVCVETTARDAIDRGYNCIIVDDACATLDQESHDASLLAFAKWFGKVQSTSEVVALLNNAE